MTLHLMLQPSLACQAQCGYCFGPNRGPAMSHDTFDQAVEWIKAFAPGDEDIHLTFHGGEPLLVGREWYERNLPILRKDFGQRIKLQAQSNLWLLDDALCSLLAAHQVGLGTSLDGPEHINDRQRGEGYFKRTLAGIEVARRHGIEVGVISTFTRLSAPHYREVLDFFAREQLAFSVHLASGIPARNDAVDWGLTAAQATGLLVGLFDHYLDNIQRVRIPTFDAIAHGISGGQGGICTFTDCLGRYLTVASDGGIYPCNRLSSQPRWRLGSVQHMPDREALKRAAGWQELHARQSLVRQDCGPCPHFERCKGGCAYNAIAGGIDHRDPYCEAYRNLFDHITERAVQQIFTDANMQAVVSEGLDRYGLLRKGPLLHLMRGGTHPQILAGRAREVVAAVALADSKIPDDALAKLERVGLVARPELALHSLGQLQERLDRQPREGLGRAYIHVTFACNLSCDHCYAQAGPHRSPHMSMADITQLMRQTARAGFREIVITGGDPMAHPKKLELLDAMRRLRAEVKPSTLVLRTNLAYPMPRNLAGRLLNSADHIIVSIDGDESTHDARRGAGTYARTVANLRLLGQVISESTADGDRSGAGSARLLMQAALTSEQIQGAAGAAVRTLSQETGAPAKFKSLLPIGRGMNLGLTLPCSSISTDPVEALGREPHFRASCGLGMNLTIGPSGECYPCYALMNERHMLGNALKQDLPSVLRRNDAYRNVTVDSNRGCRRCSLRYLCGGLCRAWYTSDDPDGPPLDCSSQQTRARGLLLSALECLEVSRDRWQAAGLPL